MSGLVSLHVLSNQLERLADLLPGEGDAFSRAYARQVLAYADEEVPVATGALRETGDVGSADGGYAVTYGGGAVDYAGYVYFGARGRPGDPWLHRAEQRAQGDRARLLAELRGRLENT